MEKLFQYLDDLDDLLGALGLLAERLRNLAWLLVVATFLLIVEATGILLALSEPTLGLAIVILLFVILLYRAVTRPGRGYLPHYEAA